MAKQLKTSWESSAKWYDESVGGKGHYYHEKVIFPKLLLLMKLDKNSKVLDLACGQGVLARKLPKNILYAGVDVSKSLIRIAKERTKGNHQFYMHDVTKPFNLPFQDFTHATIILALQNLKDPLQPLKNAHDHLIKGGKLSIVLNHPCFRIPRQSHWGIDEEKRLQYRRLDSYLSSQEIPIQMHPGKKGQSQTVSFHHPLSIYMRFLKEAGFVIEELEEWVSDKKSTGSKAQMENRARREFPLFLTLICHKLF